MKIYIPLLKNLADYWEHAGAFRTREEADAKLRKLGVRCGAVKEEEIAESEIRDGKIYIASFYLSPEDFFAYKGVFTDYEVAKRAAGDPCEILGITI